MVSVPVGPGVTVFIDQSTLVGSDHSDQSSLLHLGSHLTTRPYARLLQARPFDPTRIHPTHHRDSDLFQPSRL